MVESETQLLLQPALSPEPVEGEMEALLQPKQLQQEVTWMEEFTSSLDDKIRRDDPEQVVSEYLREPTPEQREDETGPAEEPLSVLIEDTDEEDPPTPDGYRYQPHEEENSPEQVPAPPIGGELEADEPDEEADEPDEGDEPDEEEEPEEGNEPNGEEDQDEAEPEAVEQDEEEEPEVAEEQDEEVEEEEEIEIEINVEVEIEIEEEEEPVEDELEQDEEEDEWPLGDFEEGEEGELIGPDGEEEEQPDDDGWEDDDDEDSEASTVTDA